MIYSVEECIDFVLVTANVLFARKQLAPIFSFSRTEWDDANVTVEAGIDAGYDTPLSFFVKFDMPDEDTAGSDEDFEQYLVNATRSIRMQFKAFKASKYCAKYVSDNADAVVKALSTNCKAIAEALNVSDQNIVFACNRILALDCDLTNGYFASSVDPSRGMHLEMYDRYCLCTGYDHGIKGNCTCQNAVNDRPYMPYTLPLWG